MTTTIEKLARAMGKVHLEWQDEPLSMNVTRDDLHDIARAVLTALLEPSEVMVRAGMSALYDQAPETIHIFIAMIQAALDEVPE